jgi:hypothetical protein
LISACSVGWLSFTVRRLAGAWRGPIGIKPGRIYPRSPPDQPRISPPSRWSAHAPLRTSVNPLGPQFDFWQLDCDVATRPLIIKISQHSHRNDKRSDNCECYWFHQGILQFEYCRLHLTSAMRRMPLTVRRLLSTAGPRSPRSGSNGSRMCHSESVKSPRLNAASLRKAALNQNSLLLSKTVNTA